MSESESAGGPPQPKVKPLPKRDAIGYWRANRLLIAVLLVIWAAVSLGCGVVFIEPLNKFHIGNMPLGFWFAQQGSIYVFVVLIFVYALLMDVLDRKYGVRD
ncbi:MAG: DUF4212 domain-containing protein [Pirellulales bacterium]